MLMRRALLTLALSLPACGKGAPVPTPTNSAEAKRVVPDAVAPHTAPSAEANAAESSTLSDVRDYVTTSVRAGYLSRDEIIRSAVDAYSEDVKGIDLEGVSAHAADQELAAQRQREATWSSPTDCDRLDLAFAALEKSGIVARQNFSDCGTCGAAEIEDELEQARAAGGKARGYVFFHQQDSEGALDGSLYLSYGSVDASEGAQLAVAREVIAALHKAGLPATWNGRMDTRVGISPIEWHKRRFTKAPTP